MSHPLSWMPWPAEIFAGGAVIMVLLEGNSSFLEQETRELLDLCKREKVFAGWPKT